MILSVTHVASLRVTYVPGSYQPTSVRGTLLVKWAAVAGNKGYLLQCAEVVDNVPGEWHQVYSGGKFQSEQKNLTPGKMYAFRVAAFGGSTGQSDWSPVVMAMA